MSCQDVEDFVYQAVADGAGYVFTYIEAVLCRDNAAEKVKAFIAAAKQAKKLLDDGAGREEVGQRVSPAGRKKFWDNWLE